MSVDFLSDIEQSLDRGTVLFACPSANSGEWILSKVLDDLRPKAQRAANSKKHELHIYRIVNAMDAVTGDSFLVVRKFLEPQTDGTPRMHWALVDTREASEVIRDVSQGPSPYFGAVIEETYKPTV